MHRITRHLSPALVVALVALFCSLAGGAVAASVVSGKQIKNGSVTGADLKDRSVTGRDLRKGSVGADRLTAAARASLRGATGAAGPRGVAGPQGPKGEQGPAGPGSATQTFSQSAFGRFTTSDGGGTVTDVSSFEAGSAFRGATGPTPRIVTVRGLVDAPTGDGDDRLVAVHVCMRPTEKMQSLGIAVDRVRPDLVDGIGDQETTPVGSEGTVRTTPGCVRIATTDGSLEAGDALRVSIAVRVNANDGTIGGRFRLYSTAVETAAA